MHMGAHIVTLDGLPSEDKGASTRTKVRQATMCSVQGLSGSQRFWQCAFLMLCDDTRSETRRGTMVLASLPRLHQRTGGTTIPGTSLQRLHIKAAMNGHVTPRQGTCTLQPMPGFAAKSDGGQKAHPQW